MTSFKEFLTNTIFEAIAVKWDISEKRTDDAIKILNTHCKQGLLAIKKGGLLWRGFGKQLTRSSPDFHFIDTTNSLRTSRDYDNAYMLLMNASKHLSDYPSRSNSLICTTDIQSAQGYSSSGATAWAVIPFDGAKIAYAEGYPDFNEVSSSKSILSDIGLTDTLAEIHLKDFFRMIAQPTPVIGKGGKKGNEFTDHKVIDIAMSKYSLIELTLLWGIMLGLSYGGLALSKKQSNDDAEKYDTIKNNCRYIGSMSLANGIWKNKKHEEIFHTAVDAISNKKILFDEYLYEFHKLMKNAPTDKRFSYLASQTVKPKHFDLKLVNYGAPLPDATECWVAGKAIIISENMMRDIVCELYYRDRKSVHYTIYEIFNDYDNYIEEYVKARKKQLKGGEAE